MMRRHLRPSLLLTLLSITTSIIILSSLIVKAAPTTRIISHCGVHDERIDDPNLILNFQPDANLLIAPCSLLDISNKNVHSITFRRGYTILGDTSSPRKAMAVNKLVVRNSVLDAGLSIDQSNINVTASSSAASIDIVNITIVWKIATENRQALTLNPSLIRFDFINPAPQPTSSSNDDSNNKLDISISNCKIYHRTLILAKKPASVVAIQDAPNLRNVNFINNHIETDHEAFYIDRNDISGEVNVASNTLLFVADPLVNSDILFQPTKNSVRLLFLVNSVIRQGLKINNNRMKLLVNHLPDGLPPKDNIAHTSYGIALTNLEVSNMLEIFNNSIDTTSYSISFVRVLASGIVKIASNNITYIDYDEYDTGVDNKINNLFTYRIESGIMLLEIESKNVEEPLDFYLIDNIISKTVKFHRNFDEELINFNANISNGNEFVISGNNLTADFDKLSPPFAPTDDSSLNSYDFISSKKSNLNVSRVHFSKNNFWCRRFNAIRGIDLLFLENRRTCGSAPSSSFEISENTFDFSMRTPVALATNWKVEFEDTTDNAKAGRIFDSTAAMTMASLAKTRDCGLINISSNIAYRMEFYRPLVFASYSQLKLAEVGLPSTSFVGMFEFGDRFNTPSLLVDGNRVRASFVSDKSLYNTMFGITMKKTDFSDEGFSFREVTITNNYYEFVPSTSTWATSSSTNSFVFASSFEDLPFLDKLTIENNHVNISHLSFIPCAFCTSSELPQLIAIAAILNPPIARLGRATRSLGMNPFASLVQFPSSGANSSSSSSSDETAAMVYSIRSNVLTLSMPSRAEESDRFTCSVATMVDSIGKREKELTFENNTLNVMIMTKKTDENGNGSPLQIFNFFSPSTLLNIVSLAPYTKLIARNNKHIFVNTNFGVAASFLITRITTTVKTNNEPKTFDISGNQVIRRVDRDRDNDHNVEEGESLSSSSSYYYKLLHFTLTENFVVPQWQELLTTNGNADDAPASLFFSIFNAFQDSTAQSSSPGSSTQKLTITNNFIDMTSNGSSSATDNIFALFNKTNYFDEIEISNNNYVQFPRQTQHKAKTCALVVSSSDTDYDKLTVENNQIDFGNCERTSSIINTTTAMSSGGDISVNNNRMNCGGGGCLFASVVTINDDASALSFTMKSNRITIDKQHECEYDERQYFYAVHHQGTSASSSPIINLDVSSDTFETNCNEIIYQNDETRILNGSGLVSLSSSLTVHDQNCQAPLHQTRNCAQNRKDDHSNMTRSTSNNDTDLAVVAEDDEPLVSPLRTASENIITTSVGLGLISSMATSNPAGVFIAVRSRAVLDIGKKIADGTCGGDEAELEIKPDFSTSPFQMYFSHGGYAAGATIGNFVFLISVFVLVLIGYSMYKHYATDNNYNNSSKKKRTHDDDTSIKQLIVKSKSHTVIFFGIVMVLQPTLNFALLLTSLSSISVVWKVVSIFIWFFVVLVLLCFVGMVYFLLFRRKRFEIYVKAKHTEIKENDDKNDDESPSMLSSITSPLMKFLRYLVEPEGEWKLPQETENNIRKIEKNDRRRKSKSDNTIISDYDRLMFDLAVPVLEGYSDRFARFFIIDLLLLTILAFAIFAGNQNVGCFVMAVIVIVALFLYAALTIFYRPFVERLFRVATPFLTLFDAVFILCAVLEVGQDVINSMMVVVASLQLIVSNAAFVAFLLPFAGFMIRRMRKFLGNDKDGEENRKSRRTNFSRHGRGLEDLMLDHNNNHSNNSEEMMMTDSLLERRHRHSPSSSNRRGRCGSSYDHQERRRNSSSKSFCYHNDDERARSRNRRNSSRSSDHRSRYDEDYQQRHNPRERKVSSKEDVSRHHTTSRSRPNNNNSPQGEERRRECANRSSSHRHHHNRDVIPRADHKKKNDDDDRPSSRGRDDEIKVDDSHRNTVHSNNNKKSRPSSRLPEKESFSPRKQRQEERRVETSTTRRKYSRRDPRKDEML